MGIMSRKLLATLSLFLALTSTATARVAALHPRHLEDCTENHCTDAKCVDGLMIFGARGAGGGPPRSLSALNYLGDKIYNQIPGSQVDGVPYDRHGLAFQFQTAEGGAAVQKKVAAYIKKCPKTPVALIAYSEGSVSMMNGVCGTPDPSYLPNIGPLDASLKKNIVAINIYGDITWTGGLSFDRGTCKRTSYLTRLDTTGCKEWEDIMESWCDDTDHYCCGGTLQANGHFVYFRKYDDQVAKHIVERYHAWKKAHHQKIPTE